jgi:hypothetical protein
MTVFAAGQDVVPLYPGTPPGSAQENYPEKQYFSKVWQEDVVANVTWCASSLEGASEINRSRVGARRQFP